MRFKRMMACLVAVSLVFSCMATNAFADDNADAVGPNTSQGTGETPEEDEALKAKQEEENSVQQSDDQNSNSGNSDSGNSGGDTSDSGNSDSGNSGGGSSQSATLGSGTTGGDTSLSGAGGGGTTGGGASLSGASGGGSSQSATLVVGSLDFGTSQSSADEGDGEIAKAIANGTWGQEYTTCKKCGKHDWWKMPDGTFKCKDCGFTTTGVKETSNVTVWPSEYDSTITVNFIYTSRKELESSSKGTVNDSQLIKITPEATLSLNPVQALADKREMDYLNSVRKYQLDIAAREQNYLESVQQQQQAAIQFENAYTEMVLTVAAQLQQEAEKREAAYLTAAMTAAGQAQQEAEKREAARGTMAGYFTQVDTKTGQLTVN